MQYAVQAVYTSEKKIQEKVSSALYSVPKWIYAVKSTPWQHFRSTWQKVFPTLSQISKYGRNLHFTSVFRYFKISSLDNASLELSSANGKFQNAPISRRGISSGYIDSLQMTKRKIPDRGAVGRVAFHHTVHVLTHD